MTTHYRLLTPGPVQLPEEVLRELAKPMLHHRTPEFEAILVRTLENLKKIFQTTQPVFIHSSTGSGGMESALVNTMSPGDHILVVVSGKFGERWREIAQAYQIKVTSIEVPWGEAVKASQVREALQKDASIKAVLTQACETSTAVLHPIKEIADVVRDFSNCIFMVDAITALGVIDLPMDAWGLDVVVAGSQKAFMLPTGLSMISFSKKAWPFVESAKCPRFYWDVRKEKKAVEAKQTYFSSSVALIRALDVAMGLMLKDGLPKFIARFEKLAIALRAGLAEYGMEVYAKSPSPSVTAFTVPKGVDSEKLRGHLESKYNITIMGGQDHLKGKIVRIGTLGYIREDDILAVTEALGKSLTDLGLKVDIESAMNQVRAKLK